MPKTILVEGCNLTLAQGTGIATYARNLTRTLKQAGLNTELLVETRNQDQKNNELNEIYLEDATPAHPNFLEQLRQHILIRRGRITASKISNLSVVVQSQKDFGSADSIFIAAQLDTLARRYFSRTRKRASITLESQTDLFHATQAIPLKVEGRPNIYTIHDIVPIRLPWSTLDNKAYYVDLIRHLCRTADHIVTVSEFSRRDIIEFTGLPEDKITNTYQTVSFPAGMLDRDRQEDARLVKELFDLEAEEYFLFIGAIEPKKNIPRMIDAFSMSKTNKPLIIVGGNGWQNDVELGKITSEQFLYYEFKNDKLIPRRKVRRLEYLNQPHLFSLLRCARALIFPSLYEGFGLPVLEAMTVGTPVITSNSTSLSEIAGDAAVTVDPLDIQDISAAIRAIDADKDLRADLSARGSIRAKSFSPSNYQNRIERLYRHVMKS